MNVKHISIHLTEGKLLLITMLKCTIYVILSEGSLMSNRLLIRGEKSLMGTYKVPGAVI